MEKAGSKTGTVAITQFFVHKKWQGYYCPAIFKACDIFGSFLTSVPFQIEFPIL